MIINEDFWRQLQNLPEDIEKEGGLDPGMVLVDELRKKVGEVVDMVRFMHTEHYDPAEFTFALGELIMYVAKLSDRFDVSFNEILFYLQTAVSVQIENEREVEDGK